MARYSNAVKSKALDAIEKGQSAASVSKELKVPISTLYLWITANKKAPKPAKEPKATKEKKVSRALLEKENEYLKSKIAYLEALTGEERD